MIENHILLYNISTLGAMAMDTAYTLGTVANSTIEEVALKAPTCLKFFQLYMFLGKRDYAAQLVCKAEKNDFKAIFLTVDDPVPGKHIACLQSNFSFYSIR